MRRFIAAFSEVAGSRERRNRLNLPSRCGAEGTAVDLPPRCGTIDLRRTMKTIVFPKVEAVIPLPEMKLLVQFAGGEQKLYDCHPLIDREPFSRAKTSRSSAKSKWMPGGYGISWNDSTDLSESELWLNGKTNR